MSNTTKTGRISKDFNNAGTFNMAKMKRDFAAKIAKSACRSVKYRGHVINGVPGRNWFVSEAGRDWLTLYTSMVKAQAAVDRCWAVRAIIAAECSKAVSA